MKKMEKITLICFCLVAMSLLSVSSPARDGEGVFLRKRDNAVMWEFDLSGKGDFFSLPFPTELLRKDDGDVDVGKFPNPLGLTMVERIKSAFENGYGYSPGSVVYFRWTGPINRKMLGDKKSPQPIEAPIFLVDVDPDSPERGKRYPVMAHFYDKNKRWLKGSKYVLAVMPVPGFVLRENTLYAAGVMKSLGDADGKNLSGNSALIDMAGGRAPKGALGQKALEVYGPVLTRLDRLGYEVNDMAALTVFRTGDPTERFLKLFEGILNLPVVEMVEPLKVTREYDTYYVIEGVVEMPQFQEGEYPYHRGKGGTFRFDENGKPVAQWTDRVPICITVPKARMPQRGFPILMYHHGTSGISTQFVDRGVVKPDGEVPPAGTGPAMVAAYRGIAMAGAAQPRNRQRGGTAGKTGYYNFLNPEAVRDNFLQASIEAALFLRFLKSVRINPKMCPETETGSSSIRFDHDLIFSMGHSMGSITQGPWAGVETDLAAVIPSGHGPYWALQIAEGNQFNLKRLRKKGLGTGEGLLGMDRYHPLLNLLAAVLAPADPFVYEPHYVTRPLPDRKPKHVWVSFGTNDHYYPPSTQNASILSIGLDFAGPVIIDQTARMLELAGLRKLEYPVSANRRTPGGDVTAVAVQYEELPPPDGHNINFQRDETRFQWSCFLYSIAVDGVPTVYAPGDGWDAECAP